MERESEQQRLDKIHDFVQLKLDIERYKITEYPNCIKIHSYECDRDVSIHNSNGGLSLHFDSYADQFAPISEVIDLFNQYFHFSRLHSSAIAGDDYFEIYERNEFMQYFNLIEKNEPKIHPCFDYVLNAQKKTFEDYKKFEIDLIDQDIEFINDRMAECFHNADCRLTEDSRAEHLAFYVSVKKHLKTLRRQYQTMIEAVNWEDE